MGKNKKKRGQAHAWYPPSRKNAGKIAPKNLCRSLIPLDTERIKGSFRLECQEARERFENIRKNLDFYDKQEKPAYASWLRLQLGVEFSEFKRMQEEINRKNLIFQELEYRGRSNRKTDRTEIYEQLLKELAAGIEEPFTHARNEYSSYGDRTGAGDEYGEAGNDGENDSDMDDGESWDDFEMDPDFKDEFDDMDEEEFMRDPLKSFNKMLDMMLGKFEDEDGSGRRKVKKNKIKDVYREICKKLHPDTGAEFHEKNSRLWHEAQDAYEHRDLGRLETVLAICEMESGNIKGAVTCSQMLEVINHYKEGVESVRDILMHARRAEDWNFMSWGKKEKQRKLDKLKSLVKKDIEDCRRNIEYIETRINRWKMSGKPKPKPKPKPGNVRKPSYLRNQMSFDF
jgi:hypothetical protein